MPLQNLQCFPHNKYNNISKQIAHLLPRLGGETDKESVKSSGDVHQLRVEEGGRERDAVRLLAVVVNLLNQAEQNQLNHLPSIS